MPAFRYQNLSLLNSAFDSPLVDVVTELEHLRRLQLGGAQPAMLSDQSREMANIQDAMTYIEEHFQPSHDVTEHVIRELHAMAVHELEREGDVTPGAYRQVPVQISQSEHLPPNAVLVFQS
jgi:Fic family protein